MDMRIYLDPDDAYQTWEGCVHEEERLKFAFAGTTVLTEGDGDQPASIIRKHCVDFHETDADNVKDESNMFPQPNGDVLEKVTMEHPETGKEENFVHCWEKLSIDEGPKIGWVWKVEGKEKGIREMLIRIGSVAQGIYRQGEEVRVARTTGIGVAENGWDNPSFRIEKADVSLTELFFNQAHVGQRVWGNSERSGSLLRALHGFD